MFINLLKSKLIILITSAIVLSVASCTTHVIEDPPATVAHVDIGRYLGTWYEIAHIPNRFQKNCTQNTMAEYQPVESGRIAVLNRCTRGDGTVEQADGIARIVDPDSNSRLKVSFVRIFGINLFWGDYWILGLDPEYNYAVVGAPDRKYAWVLSRTPALSAAEMVHVWSIVEEQGYDPEDFTLTRQVAESR
ncbi:MAG: lipocalin family protein [Gammaproteobacteria bacterium]|nr:MAG: lipocalin family protein [Gammaproteobacteria bacterium]